MSATSISIVLPIRSVQVNLVVYSFLMIPASLSELEHDFTTHYDAQIALGGHTHRINGILPRDGTLRIGKIISNRLVLLLESC